ncbi:EAL domain-containing protein [Actinoplanes sp. NPDC051513]|uniref:EAL domain-containing protein n=1 Tax=Actinoplanes sp. NPDC051513 TaxID=3363908 RepID=UPI0037ACA0A6
MTEKRFAVVVGVDDSSISASLPGLRYAVRDAEAIRDLLCDPRIGTHDPADVEIFAGPQSSAAAIKTALRRIALNSDPTDSLLVYFAGHTLTPAWSPGSDVYLVTPDLDEAALSYDPDAGLRMSYLQQDVFELFAGSATLILDCCRAGSPLAAPGRPVDLISVAGRDDARYCALATCAGDSAAREDPSHGHGVLTHHVLEALRGGAADADGRVTFSALSSYVLSQDLEPLPSAVVQSWGATAALTVFGPGSAPLVIDAGPVPAPHPLPVITLEPIPAPRSSSTSEPRPAAQTVSAAQPVSARRPGPVEVMPLENPIDRHATAIAGLIDRLSGAAREAQVSGAMLRADRVHYLMAATGAESVALLEYTPTGITTIDATARFDQDGVQTLLHFADDPVRPPSLEWFGRISRDATRTVLCVPVSRSDDTVLLLAVVDPPPALVAIGQPMAKVIETIWRTDFAASPAEAEIQVLTALRETFGRLPNPLYERCFRLYHEVLQSFRIVFQPVITIGPAAANVSVHSYEALARRSLDESRAPFAMLQIARTWGDRFVVERDKVILRSALRSYAVAHAEGPWDEPKPVSVNVSVRALLDDSYVETLREAIAEASLRPDAVTLEISEQDPIEPRDGEQWPDEPHAYFHKRLAAIARDVGVAFAVDDFGTGYASLSRMAELPLTQIKVDRAILHHPQALQELALVVAVARDTSHGPRVVIVEGVDDESPLTLRQIFERRIKHIQGYITREPAAPRLRRLRHEARKEIAALVRGDDGNRPSRLAAEERDFQLRRGA